MVFNINEFRSALNKHGIMRHTNYAVNITPPASVHDPIVADIPLLCDSAQIPGTSFNTSQITHKGYGLEERRAIGLQQEDVTLSFIADGRGKLIKFFDKWGNKVVNSHSSTGAGTERVGYPNDYYGTIDLYTYDTASNLVSTYNYIQAWPVNIGNIQIGWGMNDAFVIVPVTFSYRIHLSHLNDDAAGYSVADYRTLTNSTDRSISAIQTAINTPDQTEYLNRLYNIGA